MTADLEFATNRATAEDIAVHLTGCDASFIPRLSLRVDLSAYSQKLANLAETFEAWSGDTLVGLVAVYCNDRETRVAHISSVSVLAAWSGQGIASRLVRQGIAGALAEGMDRISLEVHRDNAPAIGLYERCGFATSETASALLTMRLDLEGRK